MYTKMGKPLQVNGSVIYRKSGKVVGKINGNKVFGKDGRYVGTIDGDRLVYRSIDRAGLSSPFVVATMCPIAAGRVCASAIMGEEPNIPD